MYVLVSIPGTSAGTINSTKNVPGTTTDILMLCLLLNIWYGMCLRTWHIIPGTYDLLLCPYPYPQAGILKGHTRTLGVVTRADVLVAYISSRYGYVQKSYVQNLQNLHKLRVQVRWYWGKYTGYVPYRRQPCTLQKFRIGVWRSHRTHRSSGSGMEVFTPRIT